MSTLKMFEVVGVSDIVSELNAFAQQRAAEGVFVHVTSISVVPSSNDRFFVSFSYDEEENKEGAFYAELLVDNSAEALCQTFETEMERLTEQGFKITITTQAGIFYGNCDSYTRYGVIAVGKIEDHTLEAKFK